MACYRAMTQLVILSKQEPGRSEKIAAGEETRCHGLANMYSPRYRSDADLKSTKSKSTWWLLFNFLLILHFNHLKRLTFRAMCQEWGVIKVHREWRSITMIVGILAASRCRGQSNWPEIIEVWYSRGVDSLLETEKVPRRDRLSSC